jgi:hypothetical protein
MARRSRVVRNAENGGYFRKIDEFSQKPQKIGVFTSLT